MKYEMIETIALGVTVLGIQLQKELDEEKIREMYSLPFEFILHHAPFTATHCYSSTVHIFQ